MTFEELIDTAVTSENNLIIPENWSQGRTAYGGLVAAMIYANMRNKVAEDRLVRSVQISFIGPTLVSKPFQLSTTILRQGKSVSQLQGTISQDNKLCTQIYAAFGKPVPSTINYQGTHDITDFDPQDHSQAKPSIPPELSPSFINYFDILPLVGDYPFSGSKEEKMGGLMRFKDEPKQFHETHLIAAIDCWPPATLAMTTTIAPASTMMWNIEFAQPQPTIEPTDYLSYLANIRHCDGGYGYTAAKIWNKENRLVALSNQTVITYG